ncbi:family 78 glycoside hydrolase catalytic domain [Opitutus sp. ER46]|uniref:family 78 glycoside hydrolase catalytic domain n=1 Tax=Opitutus sp. ER46 TaxID=2161864 RepID=UPI000D2FF6B7|nr:family 78 glycoside hydrolase catalytic domain [Opitutus sp. ER46]PTX98952.1 rhamnosidase [Opitutus sp. ER46]
MKHLLFILAGVALTASAAPAVESSLQPRELRCEHRVNPLGIGETKPRLNWKLETRSDGRGLAQSGYQILVASAAEKLARDEGDLWDTGRVASAATTNIIYQGRPLAARAACWWKVRLWDQDGRASTWSPPGQWTVGLLSPDDWQAEWIGFEAPAPAASTAVSDEQRARLGQAAWITIPGEQRSRPEPLTAAFRRSLVLPADRPVTRATVLLTPDMRAAISVNGQLLAEVNRWEQAVPLSLLDRLTPGENVIGVRVSQDDGYLPAVLGEVELTFANGEVVRYPLDASWQFSPTPADGWDRPGFDATSWAPAILLVEANSVKPRRSPWGTPQNALHTLAPVPMLRKTFKIEKPVRRATVYATALGVYELQLNGTRVGSDYLTPGWTEYRRRVHYQTYDVTSQLRPGANALGALLGDGWFAGVASYTGRRGYYGGTPRLRAQLEIEYADGTRTVVATDRHWRAAFGPVRHSDLYLGYAYDARLTVPDWTQPTFNDSAWKHVRTGLADASPRGFTLEAATLAPVQVVQELPAIAVTEPVPGHYVFDFGQNMVGWVRLKVRGQAGQRLVLRHSEFLNPNGTIYTSNLRGAAAVDTYWLRGDAEEALEPFGTVHGFRYVEITGLTAQPGVAMATGVVVHNPMAQTGEFTCSDPLLNQLFRNIVWGQKGNYLEAPTDCPQRDERLGWTGDTQFFVRTGLYNFDAQDMIERWLTTLITDSQGENGAFPRVAPGIDAGPQFITAWGDAAIICTHALWQVYGDTRVIERHFDRLGRYLAGLRSQARHGVVSIGGYGDWLNLGGGAKREVMDTAYYAHLCGLMSELATAIGRPDEAKKYAAEQAQVTAAWRQAFLQPDGSILESSQTGFALAFTMGLIPDAQRAAAATRFVDEIRKQDWHLATGFIGTPRLLPALHEAGRNDVAYRLLQTRTYPSWLFQVTLGATTMWERWDGWTPDRGFQTIDMNSFNHYAFGAVAEYLYRTVLGINTDGPGFRRIQIAPYPGGTLTHASGHYDAPTGRIQSSWRLDQGTLTLRVQIPANTTATVRVPATDTAAVQEGGRPAIQAPGVKLDHKEADAAVFQVVSGSYEFTSRYTAPAGPN